MYISCCLSTISWRDYSIISLLNSLGICQKLIGHRMYGFISRLNSTPLVYMSSLCQDSNLYLLKWRLVRAERSSYTKYTKIFKKHSSYHWEAHSLNQKCTISSSYTKYFHECTDHIYLGRIIHSFSYIPRSVYNTTKG